MSMFNSLCFILFYIIKKPKMLMSSQPASFSLFILILFLPPLICMLTGSLGSARCPFWSML
ncbi:hypothetical protein HanIR_Chr11g0560901 [Helianthus annuus]|nr:hypothetical protein HanIR_Chr11g0560901 [Helianthus annuus]